MAEEKELLYRLWLNDFCNHNPEQVNRLLQELGTPEEIFQLDLTKPVYSKYLRIGQKLRISKNLDVISKRLEDWQKMGVQVLSIDDEAYPDRLREVYAPPQVLYIKGKMPDFNKMLGITVVGSREASDDGRKFAREMAQELAKNGGIIVSGLAKGADGAALWGALEAGGITVAVLAGGVDKIYPRENTELYHRILDRGCIISEQPPQTTGKRYFYEQRNRIMVGLAHGVVVVEGKSQSGTAITARHAIESNADVFAVPGNPMNVYAELPNGLIRDGCIPVTGAMDIVEEYIDSYPEKLEYGVSLLGKPVVGVKPESQPRKGLAALKEAIAVTKPKASYKKSVSEQELTEWFEEKSFSEEEREILRFLWERGDEVPFDDIADVCSAETGLLSSQLIILQMKKAISQSAGGRYKLRIGGMEDGG